MYVFTSHLIWVPPLLLYREDHQKELSLNVREKVTIATDVQSLRFHPSHLSVHVYEMMLYVPFAGTLKCFVLHIPSCSALKHTIYSIYMCVCACV